MKLRLRPKANRGRHEQDTLQKRQQAYHYSSQRSNVDRLNQSRQPNSEVQTSSKKLRNIPNLFGFLLIAIGILYLLHLSPNARIQSIAPSGEFIGDKNAVQMTANDHIRSSVLNRFKPFFDSDKLEESLRSDFPEFSDIQVKTNLLWQRPLVSINFATPTLLMNSGSQLFIISETGRSIADASLGKQIEVDTSSLPLLQDLSGVEIKLGAQALTGAQVDYIKEINFQTSEKGLKVSKMELMPGGGELRVYYANKDYYVKYNFYEDARKSSGAFLATMEDLEKRGKEPKEYIDVRVTERAYVK